MDILHRALSGLAGSQASKSSSKPKGVLFFAGPTGTGKTELAKSLTEGLFGDERSYIRFDMSEFNHEHADQRLVGAPPGYLGFEAGGELTDAIREKPNAVVLFDEIEKAHKKILDKFLQILDDGQLTSGKGERVYFSEAIIIFTSNLGVGGHKTSPEDDYEALEKKVRTGVSAFFTTEINRPELLNRIGDNIVVFDYIRPEVAEQILRKMVSNIGDRIRDSLGIEVSFTDHAYAQLVDVCTRDLAHGGRGIGNKLESNFINPLAREIYRKELHSGDRRPNEGNVAVTIEAVTEEDSGPQLTVRVQRA
jgi:ATP-dependent Clp protease ATP-binding subunit ClpB